MIKKLFYFFNKKQKKTLFFLYVFMLMATVLELAGLGFIFSIAGSIGSSNVDNFFVNKLGAFFNLDKGEILSYLLLGFLFFYVFKIIFLVFYNWYESNFLYSYREVLSSKVFGEYLNQNFSYFYNRNSSEFLRNLITEVDQFTGFLVSFLKLTLEIIVAAGILILLAYINLYFTVLIAITFLFFSFIYFYLIKDKLSSWGTQRQSYIQKRIQFMQEGFDGIKIIRLLGREKFFFDKFKFYNLSLSKIAIKGHFVQGVPRLLFEFIGIFFISLSLFFLYYSGKNLMEIIQLLSIYIAASFRILPSVNRMVSSLQYMRLSFPSLNVLHNELNSFKKNQETSYDKFTFNKNISVDIKKFKYPNSNNFEISDVKLNISKGQKIGIIGPSASGKSTVVEILCGISEQPKGSITVDDKSIFSNLRGWQKLIGLVPQKIFILDDSLRNNILFGLNNKKYTDSQIVSMIKKLSLEGLLKRLPNGLDGNLGEEGINLSGGEIQRIGLCRALIYEPEILFLDEATSSLDTKTESEILQELKVFKEKTIISIAHRINTLKNCEKIYSFSNGRIVDQGNFEKFRKQNELQM